METDSTASDSTSSYDRPGDEPSHHQPPEEEQSALDPLLHDATQNIDPVRRDRAIKILHYFAERLAAERSPGHAQSAAASAVAVLERKISARKVQFSSRGELMSYLGKIVRSKVVTRLRSDKRNLGQPLFPRSSDECDPILEAAASDTAIPLAERDDIQLFLSRWLGRFPEPMKRSAVNHVVKTISRLEIEEKFAEMTRFEVEVSAVVRMLEHVLTLFPEALRHMASVRLSDEQFTSLPSVLLDIEKMMNGARTLKPLHGQVIEMREAGFQPKDIARKLGISAVNVRIIHYRLRRKVARVSEDVTRSRPSAILSNEPSIGTS